MFCIAKGCTFVEDNQRGYQNYKTNIMTDKQKIKVYFMQAVALSNYSKLCIKLKEVPKIEVIKMLENCEDVKALLDSNKIFTSHLK